MDRPLLIVFTDLDGTLLDHETYDWRPARPALDALKGLGALIVLASSKTGAELETLHAELDLGDAPVIAENGAAVLVPGEAQPDRSGIARIRAALAELPEAEGFRGFSAMSVAEVARQTGLDAKAAARAKDRCHTEPGLWTGSKEGLAAFLAALGTRGIEARRGGRFLTLSTGGTKAARMAEIAARHPGAITVALGDAPNDAEMIAAADHGVIVKNAHGPGLPTLPGEARGRIRRTELPGPEGWNAAVFELLGELGLNA